MMADRHKTKAKSFQMNAQGEHKTEKQHIVSYWNLIDSFPLQTELFYLEEMFAVTGQKAKSIHPDFSISSLVFLKDENGNSLSFKMS